MKKEMKKSTKVILIILIIVVLMAVCFGSLAVYARHEFAKEKFWLPYVPQEQSLTEIPETADEAAAYVNRLWSEAVVSDEAEGSWRTDVDFGGDMEISLPDADAAVIRFIRDGASGIVASLIPSASGVNMSGAEDAPEIYVDSADITDYPFDSESVYNPDGTYISDDYVIEFDAAPDAAYGETIKAGDVCRGVLDTLSAAAQVDGLQILPETVHYRFVADRLTDHLRSVEIVRTYKVSAELTFTGEYAPLSAEPVDITLPLKTVQHVDFKWYTARFTVGDMAVTHNDIEAMPVDIYVNESAMKGEDFNISFTYSVPDVMEIDDELVLHVRGRHDSSDPVNIVMTMEYNGHVYTDDVNVYVTDLDMVKTGVQFPFKEESAAVGESKHLITDFRVPAEEQDYTLSYETSAPEAVSIDENGMITVLRQTDEPVTVTVTLNSGGHIYQDDMIVRITAETEGSSNG